MFEMYTFMNVTVSIKRALVMQLSHFPYIIVGRVGGRDHQNGRKHTGKATQDCSHSQNKIIAKKNEQSPMRCLLNPMDYTAFWGCFRMWLTKTLLMFSLKLILKQQLKMQWRELTTENIPNSFLLWKKQLWTGKHGGGK